MITCSPILGEAGLSAITLLYQCITSCKNSNSINRREERFITLPDFYNILKTYNYFEEVYNQYSKEALAFTKMKKALSEKIVKSGKADSFKLTISGKDKYMVLVRKNGYTFTWEYNVNNFKDIRKK